MKRSICLFSQRQLWSLDPFTLGIGALGVGIAAGTYILAKQNLRLQSGDVASDYREMIRENLRIGDVAIEKPNFPKFPYGEIERYDCSLIDTIKNEEKGVYIVGGDPQRAKTNTCLLMMSDLDRPCIFLDCISYETPEKKLMDSLGIVSEENWFFEVLEEEEFSDLRPLVVIDDPKNLDFNDRVRVVNIGTHFGRTELGTMIYVCSKYMESYSALKKVAGFGRYLKDLEFGGLVESSVLEKLEFAGFDGRTSELILLFFGTYMRELEDFCYKKEEWDFEKVEEALLCELEKAKTEVGGLMSEDKEFLMEIVEGDGIKFNHVPETGPLSKEIDWLSEKNRLYISRDGYLVPKTQFSHVGMSKLIPDCDLVGDLLKMYRGILGDDFLKGWKIADHKKS